MGTVSGMLAQARATLGLGESPAGSNHNKITAWYNDEIARIGNGPWCAMAVTYWAGHSGNLGTIFAGKGVGYAYTVWFAEKFQKEGRWHPRLAGIKPGDVVFFDWSGTRQIDRIDHVGVVEHVSGGIIYTIEGNKADRCVRVARDSTYIVGYGRPAYSESSPSKPASSSRVRAWPGTYYQLKTPMMRGDNVKWIQRRLNAKGAAPRVGVDGVFGSKTDREVKDYQKAHHLEVDGIVGAKTWASLAK